jgi:hypothetical protein
VSILADLFGFIRRRVPTDPVPTVTAQVSLLSLVQGVKKDHVHLNVIQVGFDALAAVGGVDTALAKVDYAIYRIRTIYAQAGLGVGRIQHWTIPAADAEGLDDLGSEGDADDLIAAWSAPNNGIDAFVVRNISDPDFVGKASDIPGECDKEAKDDGVVAGEVSRDFDDFARTFAHEIGHHLGLEHNHDDDPDCPGDAAGCNNLMAQSRCATSCGGGTRMAVLLTGGDGATMKSHCSVQAGC